jgi:hypothetical protein
MATKVYEDDNDVIASSKPGKTREKTVGTEHPAGVYQHESAKDAEGNPVQVITLEDPLYGNTQSEAFVRVGFRRVRDAKPDEIKTLPQLSFERKERTEEGDKDARLTKVELEQERSKSARLEEELAKARAESPEERQQIKDAGESDGPLSQSGNVAKANAVLETNDRSEGSDQEVALNDEGEIEPTGNTVADTSKSTDSDTKTDSTKSKKEGK